jgi:hypothetical protein
MQSAPLLRGFGGLILKVKLIVSGETIFEKDMLPEGVSVKLDIEQTNERRYRVTMRKTFGMFRIMFAIWNRDQNMFQSAYENEYVIDQDYDRLDAPLTDG